MICLALRLQSRVGGQLLLDPTSDEAHREAGSLMLAMMPTPNLVSACIHCLCMVRCGFVQAAEQLLQISSPQLRHRREYAAGLQLPAQGRSSTSGGRLRGLLKAHSASSLLVLHESHEVTLACLCR